MMFRRTRYMHERLSALENRMEAYEDELAHALTAHQVAEAKEDLRRIVLDRGHELNREREDRAHVLAEIEDLRAELDHTRTGPPADRR
jgi:DNA repair exonuclease SbcCD ATPase subunit